MKVIYFVHDLLDAAVHRRMRMLALGGATVIPIGFRRCAEAVTEVQGTAAVDLGQTSDGKLLRRAASVGKALALGHRLARLVRGADVILARNLEMLVIAAGARARYAPAAGLVYECLDIHRTLFAQHRLGWLLRSLESRLWNDVDLLLTSSPAYVQNYFIPRNFPAPIRLTENKVLLVGRETIEIPNVRRPGPPWRIGWFGMLRCQRSLEMLCALAREASGAVEIVIRGRPSEAVFKDLEGTITGRPHVHFGGPYRNPEDLSAIYGDVHFLWAMDFSESGQNSSWLLPNRIYEGCLYGAVPIALAQVETGRWLADHGAGVLLDNPSGIHLLDLFRNLTANTYLTLACAVNELPRSVLADDEQNCRDLVAALRVTGRRTKYHPQP